MAINQRKSAAAGKKTPAKKNSGKSLAVWTFPKTTLEDAIVIPKAIEDKYAGNPIRADMLANAVGYNKASDWRFQEKLRSANLYGMVTGSGASATVALQEIGGNIVAPGSALDRKNALLAAFRNVQDFAKVQEYYGTRRIPEDEYFLNILTREFNIPRDRADVFAEVFRANVRFLASFDIQVGRDEPIPESLPDEGTVNIASPAKRETRTREFLDTCFVMMPFGGWFDRYYQEIYVPAIKDASLEPIRADELFSTGSVMEQIWEQISRSRVLLADLTNKNPNVFYELGLAHAARKPVVFTSGNIDDVPFDLRHLRVITYEVQEPKWADKLGQSITEYLRNTVKDPIKSIPHPFRAEFAELLAKDSGT
jgi:hypothetical protein